MIAAQRSRSNGNSSIYCLFVYGMIAAQRSRSNGNI